MESYHLEPEFERAVTAYCVRSPEFFARCGQAMEPEALAAPEAQWALRAAKAIAAEQGAGPGSPLVVLQRLARWVREGRCKHETIGAVDDYVARAEENLPPEHQVVGELAPVLRRAEEHKAVLRATEVYGQRGDMAEVVEMLQGAARIGGGAAMARSDRAGDPASLQALAALRGLTRLPTGVAALDSGLGGGIARGELAIAVGPTGSGKSMLLVQIAAEALRSGLNVAFATLEVSQLYTLARWVSRLTGALLEDVLAADPVRHEEVRQKLQTLSPKLGLGLVREFERATPEDLERWLDQEERRHSTRFDLLITDHLDKMDHEASTDYKGFGLLVDAMRRLGERRKIWNWTVAHSTRGKGRGKRRLDVDDVADSQNKPRGTDVLLTITPSEELQEVTLFVAKNRHGPARFAVGPLPTDFAWAGLTEQEPAEGVQAPEPWDGEIELPEV